MSVSTLTCSLFTPSLVDSQFQVMTSQPFKTVKLFHFLILNNSGNIPVV